MKTLLFPVVLFILSFVAKTAGQTHSWLANDPVNFHQTSIVNGGITVEKSYDASIRKWVISHVTNNEVWYLMQLLFYGKENGISIELGALDGTMATRCETEELEKFHWKRVVIEANPKYKNSLATLQYAYGVSAAICNSSQMLHYAANAQDPYVNGIVEFMHPNFIKKFHPKVGKYSITSNDSGSSRSSSEVNFDWPESLPAFITEVPCISMKTVLSSAGISHVNLWLLDTEGSELSILRTVDWTAVLFDVIIVETEVKNRSEEYAVLVKDYLEQRGYILLTLRRGRNSWYRHKSFVTATKAPNLQKYMHFLNNVVYAD